MTWWQEAIPGQPGVADVLGRALARGEPAHAWAFVGPAGVGQQKASRAMAAALNCPMTKPGAPCGTCGECFSLATDGLVDYHRFAREGAMYRVEDVRDEWLQTAFLSSAKPGGWKVLHIADADRMNDAAANAFLKALEEPPDRTVWVLDIADPDELPETILSRCRVLRFNAWTTEQLEQRARAEEMDEADAALAARVASGSPVVLRRLARPGGMEDLRTHRALFRRLREDGPAYSLVAARHIADEAERATAAIVRDKADELQELARGYGVEVVVPSVPQGEKLPAKQRRQLERLEALKESEEELAARPQREVEVKALLGLVEFYSEALPPPAVKKLTAVYERRQREEKVQATQAALDDMVGWLRDVLFVGAGGDPARALHRDAEADLRADADALGAEHALRAIDVLLATRESFERNAQLGLALEACFMDISALTLTAASR